MRVLALSYFDPASVVLSHRDLVRAAGHDFRLAVVRAYTERQQHADYVCERLVRRVEDVAPGVSKVQAYWEKLNPDLEALREFAASADVIQFHPGIGHGDGDWASSEQLPYHPRMECLGLADVLGMDRDFLYSKRAVPFVYFVHGSRSVWANRAAFLQDLALSPGERLATSTIDYAYELDAAYLPPLVDVGDLRAKLRGDDDPLLIAHTPTDRAACQTAEFLKAAQGLGIPVRLGEGMKHADILQLKAECNAGFDHLRGAFSTNTLENAAIGLVPLFALRPPYADRLFDEGISILSQEMESGGRIHIETPEDLRWTLRYLSENPYASRWYQKAARRWWETHFSAEPTTQRLLSFYESL